MSKYIVEKSKQDNSIFAWIGVFLLIFNVFLTIVIKIILGKEYPALNMAFLVGSVLFLAFYLFLENKFTSKYMNLTFMEIYLVLLFLVMVITSLSNLNDNFAYIVRFLFLIITISFMKFDDKLSKIVFFVLLGVMSVHLICTLWFTIDKDFYLKNILPTFDSKAQRHLYYQVVHNNFSTGFAGHFSLNGMYMAIMTILSYSILFYKKLDIKKFIFFGICLLALFMTGKRGALLFTIFAIIITYFICNKDSLANKLGKGILILVCIGAILYVLSFYIDGISSTVNRILNSGNSDVSSGRFELYKIAWEKFLDRPVLGIGWREYSNIIDKYYAQYRGSFMDAHNVYLQLLCETGIIGFGIFVGFFISSW